MKQIQQGDVLLVRVDKLPEGVQPRQDRVLATGESTGHAHVLTEGCTVFGTLEGMQWVVVEEDQVELQHLSGNSPSGDHDTAVVPQGIWMVPAQEEKGWGPLPSRVRD